MIAPSTLPNQSAFVDALSKMGINNRHQSGYGTPIPTISRPSDDTLSNLKEASKSSEDYTSKSSKRDKELLSRQLKDL